jgi:hypothetical protein
MVVPVAIPVAAANYSQLVGHWQFDIDASDRSMYGNNGSFLGNAGIVGEALYLDGDNDWVEVGDSSSLDIVNELTIEAWVQTNVDMNTNPQMQIVDKGEHTSSTGYMLMIYNGDLYGRVNKNNATACVYPYPEDGLMHHVAYTFKSGEQKLYIDGDLVISNNGATTIITNSHPLLIGSGVNRTISPDYDWTQIIDDVRIWNTALTSEQIGDVSPPVVNFTTTEGVYPVGEVPTLQATVDDANDCDLTISGDIYPHDSVGIHTVTLTATDPLGYVGSDSLTYVVYDPSGGFVTGGGWIYSDAGAYVPDPMLEGKASFGFVSKYKKGANAPDGQTEFQFKAGDLNFHSTSYDWLVVNQGGSNAQFKGTGTINGETSPNNNPYKFMIWAGDDTPDTFRIKIWYENDIGEEVEVIYDNGFEQVIGGGSIVIHKK